MRVADLSIWMENLPSFQGLKPNSKRNYRQWLKIAVDNLGMDTPIRAVGYLEADRLYLKLSTEKSSHQAVSVCRLCSVLWAQLIRYGHSKVNPFSRMRLPTPSSRQQLWTQEQVYKFSSIASKRGLSSLGLLAEMCYVFCQRPIDIRLMTREAYQGSTLEFDQIKTGVHMSLWLMPSWRQRISSVLRSHNHNSLVICELTNLPYNKNNYNVLAFDIKREARIPLELQLRDLRRTGLTEAANHDATDSELMSMGGHKRKESLRPYRLNTRQQAENGMRKRFGLGK